MVKNFFTKNKVVVTSIVLVIFFGVIGVAAIPRLDNPTIDAPGADIGLLQLTVVMPPSYTDKEIRGNYAHVWVDGRKGVFCISTMAEVVPPLFDRILHSCDDLAHVTMDGSRRFGVVDTDGQVIVPFVSDVAFSMNYGRGVVRQYDKWGAIDYAGNIYVPLEFDRAGRLFSEGLLNVARYYDEVLKWGIVDIYGREIVPLMYEWISQFKNGVARVQYGGKMGLLSKSGEFVIPPHHNDIVTLDCGVAMFKVGENRWEHTLGIIDLHDGREIAPPIYSLGPDFNSEHFPQRLFHEGLASLQRDGKWGFINMQGEEIIPFVFTWATNFFGGFSHVGYDGGVGIINARGEFVIPPGEFVHVSMLPGGLARVAVLSDRKDSRGWYKTMYGVIEIATGNVIVPPIYNEVIVRNEGFAVQYGGTESVLWFEGGRADGLWGLLDENGYEIISPMYTYLCVFLDGFALANIGGDGIYRATGELSGYVMPVGGQWLLIDKENNAVTTFEFAAMQRVAYNLLAFTEYVHYSINPRAPEDRRVTSGKWGFIRIECVR